MKHSQVDQTLNSSVGRLTCSQLALLTALAVVLGHVEALVDDARDGLDLGAELLLDALQVEAVIVRDQVDGQTQVPKTTWAGTKCKTSNYRLF